MYICIIIKTTTILNNKNMENLKKTALCNSYWNNTGAYQNEYNELYEKFVKRYGQSETLNGELIRAISRLSYEFNNNGNINARQIVYKLENTECKECRGTGYISTTFCGDEENEDENENEAECDYCCGSGTNEEEYEDEIVVSIMYEKFLELIELSDESLKNSAEKVRLFITQAQDLYSSKNQFSDLNQAIYSELCDYVMHYVLTHDDQNLPKWYNN